MPHTCIFCFNKLFTLLPESPASPSSSVSNAIRDKSPSPAVETWHDEVAHLNCGHKFHLTCLQQWTEVSTTCPCCRKDYDVISVSETVEDDIVRVIPVQTKKQAVSNQYNDLFGDSDGEIEYTYCVICRSRDNEDEMLLCDRCDDGYHQHCIGLAAIPTDDWYCASCLEIMGHDEDVDSDDDAYSESSVPSAPAPRRRPARTAATSHTRGRGRVRGGTRQGRSVGPSRVPGRQRMSGSGRRAAPKPSAAMQRLRQQHSQEMSARRRVVTTERRASPPLASLDVFDMRRPFRPGAEESSTARGNAASSSSNIAARTPRMDNLGATLSSSSSSSSLSQTAFVSLDDIKIWRAFERARNLTPSSTDSVTAISSPSLFRPAPAAAQSKTSFKRPSIAASTVPSELSSNPTQSLLDLIQVSSRVTGERKRPHREDDRDEGMFTFVQSDLPVAKLPKIPKRPRADAGGGVGGEVMPVIGEQRNAKVENTDRVVKRDRMSGDETAGVGGQMRHNGEHAAGKGKMREASEAKKGKARDEVKVSREMKTSLSRHAPTLHANNIKERVAQLVKAHLDPYYRMDQLSREQYKNLNMRMCRTLRERMPGMFLEDGDEEGGVYKVWTTRGERDELVRRMVEKEVERVVAGGEAVERGEMSVGE